MPAPPPILTNPITNTGARWMCFLGDDQGNTPGATDEVRWLVPTQVRVATGGKKLDTIDLKLDQALSGLRLQDTTAPVSYNRVVEVRELGPTGIARRTIARGKIARYNPRIGEQEAITYLARFDPFMFGTNLEGYPVWDPVASDVRTINRPVVFNPTIDDRPEGNRSTATGGTGDPYLFLDPESMRLAPARTLQGETLLRWTLGEAVHWLCWWLNPLETWVKNPTLIDLQATFPSMMAVQADVASWAKFPLDDDDRLSNHKLSFGLRLPEALDAVLERYGYTWSLVHELDTDTTSPGYGKTTTRMRFMKRGAGAILQLKLQRIGQTISARETNVDDLRMRVDLAQLANRVRCFSDHPRRESTFTLKFGWTEADDAIALDDLTDTEDQPVAQGKRDVGRKLVLNEDGGYNGLRTSVAPRTTHTDLTYLFGPRTVPVRRKFHPCLSLDADGEPRGDGRGFVVEWAQGTAAPTDDDWEPVPWNFSILQHEAGVWFEGKTPPEDFWNAIQDDPDQVHVRITATLEGDERIVGDAERRTLSPNGEELILSLDMAKKFHDRRRHSTSQFFDDGDADETVDAGEISSVTTGVAGSASFVIPGDHTGDLTDGAGLLVQASTGNDSRYTVRPGSFYNATFDETTVNVEEAVSDATIDGELHYGGESIRIQGYAEQTRDREDAADVSVSVVLPGLAHGYEMGQLIDSIDDRNITFDARDPAAGDPRHLQIMGFNYAISKLPRTEVILESHREKRAAL